VAVMPGAETYEENLLRACLVPYEVVCRVLYEASHGASFESELRSVL